MPALLAAALGRADSADSLGAADNVKGSPISLLSVIGAGSSTGHKIRPGRRRRLSARAVDGAHD